MLMGLGDQEPGFLLIYRYFTVGLGGLGVTCSPRDPKFAGSNPTEVDGFFSECYSPEYKSSKRNFKLGPKSDI